MGPSVSAAWKDFRDGLEARSLVLHDEVRSYPTPIARCDDQLPKAIALRDQAARDLQLANELGGGAAAMPHGEWLARVGELAAAVDAGEDEALARARATLIEALARR